MSHSEKKSTFFGGAAILTVGVILVKLIGALYKIPLGNILSDEAFTDFSTAYNVYNFFLTISTAGLPVALSKTISEAHSLGRRNQTFQVFRVALSLYLIMGAISFVAMSVFAQPLANLLGDPAAVYCIMALSPSVICVCIMSAFRGFAQGHSNMIPTTVSQIIESFCKLVVGLALAILVLRLLKGEDAYKQQIAAAGAIFGVSVGSILALIYLVVTFLRARRSFKTPAKDQPDSFKDVLIHLLRLAIPITFGSAAVSIVTLIDTKLVMYQLEKMYTNFPEMIPMEAFQQTEFSAQLFAARGLKGIYDKCMAVYNLPSALMVPLTACIIPAVAACLARRDRMGACRISESALRIGVLLCLPAGVGLFSLAGPIVTLLYHGLNTEIATPLMAMLGLASIFVCIMLICNSILQSHGIVNLPVFSVVVGGIIKIIVNYTLVGNVDINIQGAPVGTLSCFAVIALMDLFMVKRAIPVPPSYTKVFIKPLIASAVMGVAAWASYGLLTKLLRFGNSIATLGAIGVAVVVYLFLVVALQIISKDDLELMPKGEKIAKILHIK